MKNIIIEMTLFIFENVQTYYNVKKALTRDTKLKDLGL
jgi:hypothetical protein